MTDRRLVPTPLPIAGLHRIGHTPRADDRGSFTRLFCADELAAVGWSGPVAQVNLSATTIAGTVRGLHFQQPPHAEVKLVQCLRGVVFDVVVDLRAGSETLLQWHGERLEAGGAALLIPQGLAHGFQTLSDDVELLYWHSAAHEPAAERGLNPRDPRIGIDWPRAITEISEKDRTRAMLDDKFAGIRL
jgi:dTDP-4-dehydrorhamnose 3,5-epimerase